MKLWLKDFEIRLQTSLKPHFGGQKQPSKKITGQGRHDRYNGKRVGKTKMMTGREDR
jgi:hypothetical protein